MKLKDYMLENSVGDALWSLESHEYYTVRSAYHKLQDNRLKHIHFIIGECSDKSQVSFLWNTLWRLKLNQNLRYSCGVCIIRHFQWLSI